MDKDGFLSISLRWHYPNQVTGRSVIASSQPGYPAPLAIAIVLSECLNVKLILVDYVPFRVK